MPVKFDVPEVARSMTDPVSATPVLSIVEMRLLYPTPDPAREETEPVRATPVDSIVEMRPSFKSILAPLVALKDVPAVVCVVPSLNATPLTPSFTPVSEAMFPVVKTAPLAGYVIKAVALPER